MMIGLPKKKQVKKCSDLRKIRLISSSGKIDASTIIKILERKTTVIEEENFVFRAGKGIRDAIGLVRIISESVLEVN